MASTQGGGHVPEVDLLPWHVCDRNADTNEYFYVKVFAAAEPPQHAATAGAEPAFVLLVTDLLGVWRATVQHSSAEEWARENFPKVAENYATVFDKMRQHILGELQVPNHPPVIQVAAMPYHSEKSTPALLITTWLNTRQSCTIECAPLSPLEAAVLLRDQMILPLVHISAILRTHSTVADWTPDQATREAEERLREPCIFGFNGGAIERMYRMSVLHKYKEALVVAAPASREPTAEALPAGAPASACPEGAAEQPAKNADMKGTQGGSRLKVTSSKRFKSEQNKLFR